MINPMDMTGRCVVVTGASSGLGAETSVLLSQLGARVILVARNRERLAQTAELLQGDGHGIEPFDLTKGDEVAAWMKGLVPKYGLLDGVVHFAGALKMQPNRDWNTRDCEQQMTINLTACFALAKAFRQKGVHTQGGTIVFISSVAGLVGEIGLSVYSASKAGVVGLTRSLALELVRDGVRVNAVAPGFVHTKMVDDVLDRLPPAYLDGQRAKHPLGIGKPRDVAYAVVFLMAETGRWITGATLVVDGGYTAQ